MQVMRRVMGAVGIRVEEGPCQTIGERAAAILWESAFRGKFDYEPVQYQDVFAMRHRLRGLVVEEFQRTRMMLVAEFPRRVQLLVRDLFGADGGDGRFAAR